LTYSTLKVDRAGHVGWLEFNRPEAGNAMNALMFDELERAWRQLDDDPEVHVIVNTGTGRAFQTGLDVAQLANDRDALREQSRRTRDFTLKFTSWHNDVSKPVIAAVNGTCAGGGLHFVADADIVVMSTAATLVDPHVSIGQATVYETIGLAKKSPMEAILRLAFTGTAERIDADRAYQLGICSQLESPEALRAAVQSLAETIAQHDPDYLRIVKRALWRALEEKV
jgi:enoyl-CoA hydratase/carnithine racemase